MVCAATPDKLTVMTYLHQIKHYFENSHAKNSINLLMSQYNFMTGTEDILASPTPSPATGGSSLTKRLSPGRKSDKKKSSTKEKKSKKVKGKVDEDFGEIDSITDAREISSILNQLREDERRNELKRLEHSMNKPTQQKQQQQKPPQQKISPSNDSASFDEDEMLNSIIESTEVNFY